MTRTCACLILTRGNNPYGEGYDAIPAGVRLTRVDYWGCRPITPETGAVRRVIMRASWR